MVQTPAIDAIFVISRCAPAKIKKKGIIIEVKLSIISPDLRARTGDVFVRNALKTITERSSEICMTSAIPITRRTNATIPIDILSRFLTCLKRILKSAPIAIPKISELKIDKSGIVTVAREKDVLPPLKDCFAMV